MKALPFLVCGLLGGVCGALILHALRDDPPARTASAEPAQDEELVRRLDALEELVRGMAGRTDSGGSGGATASTHGASPADGPDPDAKADADPDGGGTGKGADDAKSRKPAELVAWLVGQRGFGNAESRRLFGWMFANKDEIPALVTRLKKALEDDPKNADLHTALATAFVGQLQFNTPTGAQQGLVWGQADAAYRQAIQLDPQHWQARFGRAFGTSFIPVQFGQRPNAIRQFEELRALQEGRAPEPGHAQTYAQLGRLYAEAGNVEKAQKVLRAGRKLFPDDQQIRAQLEVTEKK